MQHAACDLFNTMNLLAFETSSRVLSVALKKGRGPILRSTVRGYLNHAENLIPAIDHLLRKKKLKLYDIDAFLIGRGPGSFTGLRIGFATLKGFLAVKKKPCFGALSLDLTAHGIPLEGRKELAILLDARREHIYARFYGRARGKNWRPKGRPRVLGLEELLRKFPAEIHLAGDALLRYGKEIKERPHQKVHFLDEKFRYPKAQSLIELYPSSSLQRLEKPEDFLPLYFRLPEAEERKRKTYASPC